MPLVIPSLLLAAYFQLRLLHSSHKFIAINYLKIMHKEKFFVMFWKTFGDFVSSMYESHCMFTHPNAEIKYISSNQISVVAINIYPDLSNV